MSSNPLDCRGQIVIALAAVFVATISGVLPGSDYLVPLQNRLQLTSVQPSIVALSGKYSNPGPDLKKRVVPLGGRDLYLFPNGSYIYTEWTDNLPETVFDRGRWSVAGGVLKLESNATITWETSNEKQYVVVRYKERPANLFLLGIDQQLGYLKENIGQDADFMFLVTSLAFVEPFSKSNWRGTQSAVLRRAWKPKFFKNK